MDNVIKGPFKKGDDRKRGKGRPPGSQNVNTKILKDASSALPASPGQAKSVWSGKVKLSVADTGLAAPSARTTAGPHLFVSERGGPITPKSFHANALSLLLQQQSSFLANERLQGFGQLRQQPGQQHLQSHMVLGDID
jgi:hypothetical protein